MTESFTVTVLVPAPPERIYKAWLNSREHSAFTGSKAVVSAAPRGKFNAWDGYIIGKNLALKPCSRIVQAWRTTEFSDSDPDSRVEITFEEEHGKTRITLHHANIPAGQAKSYKQGWKDFYFKPMKEYFRNTQG